MIALHVIAHVILHGRPQRGAEASVGRGDLQPTIGDAGLRLLLDREAARILFGGEFRDHIVDLLILLLQPRFHDRRRRCRRDGRGCCNGLRRGRGQCALAAQRLVQAADLFLLQFNLLLLRVDHLLHLIEALHHRIIVGLCKGGRCGGGHHRGGRAQQQNTSHIVPSSLVFVIISNLYQINRDWNTVRFHGLKLLFAEPAAYLTRNVKPSFSNTARAAGEAR